MLGSIPSWGLGVGYQADKLQGIEQKYDALKASANELFKELFGVVGNDGKSQLNQVKDFLVRKYPKSKPEELQKAAQKAAQLASLPENFGNNNNFESYNLIMPQEVLDNKIDNPSINFFTNLQSHPGSVEHPSASTKSKYKASLASKKAWGNDIYNVNQHGLIEGMTHNDETFNEIKEIFYNSN